MRDRCINSYTQRCSDVYKRQDQTYPLPQPFLVLATQNPLEQEGTYPLPEAQVDRFMLLSLIHI